MPADVASENQPERSMGNASRVGADGDPPEADAGAPSEARRNQHSKWMNREHKLLAMFSWDSYATPT
jgi:hypothetical protein